MPVYDEQGKMLTGTGAAIPHSSLSGLSADDHTQYVLADGTRAFSPFVMLAEQGVVPPTPATGYVIIYADSNGDLRVIDDAGNNKYLVPHYIQLQHQAASGTHGGTFTSGSWQTRPITTEVSDSNGHCSLSSNQFTLEAGTYRITAKAYAGPVTGNRLRLYNITDSAVTALGVNNLATASAGTGNEATLESEFTIGASKTFELQHRCNSTYATTGFGYATGWDTEIYCTIELLKIA